MPNGPWGDPTPSASGPWGAPPAPRPSVPSPSVPDFQQADHATPPSVGGATTIWNLPDQLKTGKLWYDSSQTSTHLEYEGMGPNGPIYRKAKGSQSRVQKSAEEIFNWLAGLAGQGYVMDKNGKLTKTALAAQGQFLIIQQALGSGPWGRVHTSGSFDAETQGALTKALLQYQQMAQNGHAESFVSWLTQTAAKARETGEYSQNQPDQQPVESTPAISLSDPAQLRAVVQDAAMAALGHGLSEDQLNAFVSQFHAAESSYQTAYQQSPGQPGTEQLTAPDVQGQAMQFAAQADPGAAKDYREASYVSALVNLLAGPGDAGRPRMDLPPNA